MLVPSWPLGRPSVIFNRDGASLEEEEKSQVIASVQNQYKCDEVVRALGRQFDKKHEKERGDRKWSSRSSASSTTSTKAGRNYMV